MFREETQTSILEVLAGNLRRIEDFRIRGLTLTKTMFTGKNQVIFELISEFAKQGYTKLTDELKDRNSIKLNHRSIDDDELLDLLYNVRTELESVYATETANTMSKLLSDYKKATIDGKVEIREKMAEVISGAKTTQVADKTVNLLELARKSFVYEKNRERIPAYVKEVDEMTGGGLSRQGIHIISGFPGNGKTTLGVQTSTLQAINGYKVLYLSLEQPEDKILSNVLSVLAEEEKGKGKVEKGRKYWEISRIDENDMVTKKYEAIDVIEETNAKSFHIDDSTFEDDKAFIERVRRACLFEKYDVVVIDNFQNAPRDSNVRNSETAYSNLADALLDIAKHKDNNSVILALSQLTNSNGYEKTKYSARLNEHAITNLKIELVKPEEDDIDEINKVNITTLKARDGKQGITETLTFIGEKSIVGSFVVPISEEKRKQRDERREREFNIWYQSLSEEEREEYDNALPF